MLPWLLLVVVLDLVVVALDGMPVARRGVIEHHGPDPAVRRPRPRPAPAYALTDTVDGTGAALLILIPAYHAGSKYGRFGFLLTCVGREAVAFLLVGWPVHRGSRHHVGHDRVARRRLALGLLGAWNQRLTASRRQDADPAAREAIELIQRLQDLSGADVHRPRRPGQRDAGAGPARRPRCRRPAAPCS